MSLSTWQSCSGAVMHPSPSVAYFRDFLWLIRAFLICTCNSTAYSTVLVSLGDSNVIGRKHVQCLNRERPGCLNEEESVHDLCRAIKGVSLSSCCQMWKWTLSTCLYAWIHNGSPQAALWKSDAHVAWWVQQAKTPSVHWSAVLPNILRGRCTEALDRNGLPSLAKEGSRQQWVIYQCVALAWVVVLVLQKQLSRVRILCVFFFFFMCI